MGKAGNDPLILERGVTTTSRRVVVDNLPTPAAHSIS
jgi:hypothetical protein